MRQINEIIIHCAGSQGDISIDEVRRIHVEEKGYLDVGYHYLIRVNGNIEVGRPVKKIGAHTRGHNSKSIGICLAGGYDGTTGDFSEEQLDSLFLLIHGLEDVYPDIDKITGHNTYTDNKTCPNFDVSEWWFSRLFAED